MRLHDVGQIHGLDQLSDPDESRLHVLGKVGKFAVYRFIECFDVPCYC